MSTAANDWQDFFENWPGGMDRGGVLVTSYGEQIPFCGFLTKGSLLAVQRATPDSIGARQIVIPYSEILSVKITAVVTSDVFAAAGFAGEPVAV